MDETEARIRQDMEQTREAMSAKISMIQDRMEDTIEETGATVAGVVNGVMEQVQRVRDLVEHITSTADAAVTQVQETTEQTAAKGTPGTELIADLYQRPWVMMGTAVLLGYLLGSGSRSPTERRRLSVTSPPRDSTTGKSSVASANPLAGSDTSATSTAPIAGPARTPSS